MSEETLGVGMVSEGALRPHRRVLLLPGKCTYCDANRADEMMPPHDASPRCESGKHPHCTCDICF